MSAHGASEAPAGGAARLLVDADACPVKDEALEIAGRLGVEIVFVSNGGLRPSRYPGARLVTVSSGADAADDWIADTARPCDVVLTADIPLASRALEKGAQVLGPDGRAFTPESAIADAGSSMPSARATGASAIASTPLPPSRQTCANTRSTASQPAPAAMHRRNAASGLNGCVGGKRSRMPAVSACHWTKR